MPNSPAYDLATIATYQAGVLQSGAHRRIKQEVSRFLQPYGITMMEWFAVGHICDAMPTGIRLSNLARILQTTLPYTTTLMNHLEAKGWTERAEHGSDSRVRLIRLTARSEESCDKIEADLRDKMRAHLYSRITRDELQTYMKVLYKLGVDEEKA